MDTGAPRVIFKKVLSESHGPMGASPWEFCVTLFPMQQIIQCTSLLNFVKSLPHLPQNFVSSLFYFNRICFIFSLQSEMHYSLGGGSQYHKAYPLSIWIKYLQYVLSWSLSSEKMEDSFDCILCTSHSDHPHMRSCSCDEDAECPVVNQICLI